MTEPHAQAYADLRESRHELVGEVDPAGLERPAAATPGWRVRDVLAHLVGVSDDIVSDRRDGIASDAWTGAQVDRRRRLPDRGAARRLGSTSDRASRSCSRWLRPR